MSEQPRPDVPADPHATCKAALERTSAYTSRLEAELAIAEKRLRHAEEAFWDLSDRFAQAVGVAYRAGADEARRAMLGVN